MSVSNLWQLDNYNAPITALFDVGIYEYDISKANISVLADAGVISEDQYQTLLRSEREERQISIGLLQRQDPKVTAALHDGIKEARRKLFELLDIEDSNVLHINKDAVFIIKRMADSIKMLSNCIKVGNHTVFTLRSHYNTYFRAGPSLHFYYDYDLMNNIHCYDIRGMSPASKELHSQGFINVLCDILKVQQMSGFAAAYESCRHWYELLSNPATNIDNKRRFDNASEFDLRYDSVFGTMRADYLSEDTADYVDPSYNLQILSSLANVMLCYMMMYGSSTV